ncbi:MAG: diguanylate cyclase [Deltaproteobacteria bacterium]|uniref:Diguanylate cyclase n=1 Tax=Candidatus Zymogenus saltonus TaxID=2844893 RepID=A0A9D8KEP6_9DELT|nr:diguanylate cyclase [Candidatus Zymogenus saltonus]
MNETSFLLFNIASSICLVFALLFIILYFLSEREKDFALFSIFTLVVAAQQFILNRSVVFQYVIALFFLSVSFYSLFLILKGMKRRRQVYYLYFTGSLFLFILGGLDLIKGGDYVYGGMKSLTPVGSIVWAVIGASVVLNYIHKRRIPARDKMVYIVDAKRDVEDKGTLDITDPLTGLYTMEFFEECIEEEVKDSLKMNRSLSLIVADVDKFDNVVEAYGKSISDRILAEISVIIKSSIKGRDLPARYGKSLFAVILPNTKLIGAWEVGERMAKNVGEVQFVIGGKPDVFVTMSLGVTELRGSDMVEDFVKRAVDALESARAGGGNVVNAVK